MSKTRKSVKALKASELKATTGGATQYPLHVQTLLESAKQIAAANPREWTGTRVGKNNTVELQYGGGDWIPLAPSAD
jgi:hypothetical protein